MDEPPALHIQQRHVREMQLVIAEGCGSGCDRAFIGWRWTGAAEEGCLKTEATILFAEQMSRHVPPLDLELGMAAVIARELKAPPRLRHREAIGRF